jgi:putative nucleotidyltransferase with HDIG domain
MREVSPANTMISTVLSRLAIYTVLLAWIILGISIYLFSQNAEASQRIVQYFLSPGDEGLRFRALILLAPFALTVISYLINERAKLFQMALVAERELRSLNKELVLSFANALDAKSPWTMGHSERVASYALAIAKEMQFKEHDMEMLKIGSLLHDIGKIGTYDVILDKTEPLTEKEWELIKMHPSKGAAILNPVGQLKKVVPIVKYHHERFDGKGYPEGLKGHDIPLLARILCVADSFDAVTADRPYKPPMGKEEALGYMKQQAGTQFDPEIVKIFLKIFDISNGQAGSAKSPAFLRDEDSHDRIPNRKHSHQTSPR